MDSVPIGQAVLRRVVDKLGGIGAASVRMGVRAEVIAKYLDGTMLVPDVILLRAVDVVLEEPQTIQTGSQPFQRIQP